MRSSLGTHLQSLKSTSSELRLSVDRIWFYGIGLTLIGIAQIRFSASVGRFWDWHVFRDAGAAAGTAHVFQSRFVYMPGAAWFLTPFAHLSLQAGFIVNAISMVAASVAVGVLASRIYRLPASFAILCAFAWVPMMISVVIGQNAPLALLFVMVAIYGLARDRPIIAGAAIGVLLYKPTYALPFIALFLIRRQWRALAVATLCAAVWYGLSAAAAGWDWNWPIGYVHELSRYAGPDFASNAVKAVSLPGLLMRFGVPATIAGAIGVVGFLACAPLLSRVNQLEAASITSMLALTFSPHAWYYDAVLVLPTLYFVMAAVREPLRSRIIVASYAIAPLLLVAGYIGVDPLAIVVLAAPIVWCATVMSRLEEPFARYGSSRSRSPMSRSVPSSAPAPSSMTLEAPTQATTNRFGRTAGRS